jgi:hypothetical protein
MLGGSPLQPEPGGVSEGKSSTLGSSSIMTPDDLYWHASTMGPPSLERVDELRRAAASWQSQEQLLATGIALSAITHAGWGLLHRTTRLQCVDEAIAAFRTVVEQSPAGSLDALVAFKKWSEVLWQVYTDGPGGQQQHRRESEAIAIAHAERLLSQFGEHPQAVSFLVRGFIARGPVTGPWVPDCPDGEVDDGFTNVSDRIFYFNMPSAFRLLVRVGDYHAAREICLRFPSAFASPGLRGWRSAVEGFADPAAAPDAFLVAAEAFDEDTPERGRDATGAWLSINRDLWAPYFRSRSWMARAVREPERVEECISTAAGCMPPRQYSHTGVHRYHLFVQSLVGLLGIVHGLALSDARQEFEKEIRDFGDTESDPAVREFFDHAHSGFEQLRAHRRRGLTSVGRAMAALDRIPLLVGADVEAVRSAVDRHTIAILDGPARIWIHRTLESIKDEKKLQRVLLRLFQNSVPRYAQVRHGPIEYGKDIVVAAEEGGELILRMYQAKCGDIKKPDWNTIRPQLEEIFQIPLSTFQIPIAVKRRVGILVWNGHAEPHVEPIMEGWKNDQHTAFQREYQFMHLDGIVGYIFDNRLVNALREALAEAGIAVV